MPDTRPIDETKLGKSPSALWTLTEPRVLGEWAAYFWNRKKLRQLPRGDWHPVIVIPGFLGTDGTTNSLRKILSEIGYETHGWGLGQNKVFTDDRIEELAGRIKELHAQNGRKVSLIGWSMGGLFAREVAKKYPELVRCVITMGSPVSGQFNHTFAYKIYKRINGEPTPEEEEYYKTLINPPPVPTTSIYSKSDGIVAWRNSMQAKGPLTENIRIRASHSGMGVNPAVITVIADRLSQKEGDWRPYVRLVRN